MVASIQSPADAVNYALRRIGYELRVGSLWDGSRAANQSLDIYAQTRDALLRDNDWGFAERNVAMTLLKSAPAVPGGGRGYFPPNVWNATTYPPLPWLYEYAYPADCLKVRAVKPQPMFVPEFDPQPYVFGIENDNTLNPVAKVILCNVQNAVLVYTGQVTDPTSWEANFVESFADALGRNLAPVLKDLQATQLSAASGAASKAMAEANQG